MQYYKIFLQLEQDNAPVLETIEDFGFYCMDIPFTMVNKMKEPASRTWYDEHGDDEYVPSDGLYASSYEMQIKFGYKGDKFGATQALMVLLAYLRSGGLMKMYCDYTGIGRQHVRFVSIDNDAELVRDETGDLLVVKLTFKVNDPITDVELSK